MKKILISSIIGLVLIFLIFVFCFNYDTVSTHKNRGKKNTISTKDGVSLILDEKVKYEDLELELINVDDSRCPANVECYWQGELSYTFLINNKSYEIGTVNNEEINYDNYKINIIVNNCSSDMLYLKIERNE